MVRSGAGWAFVGDGRDRGEVQEVARVGLCETWGRSGAAGVHNVTRVFSGEARGRSRALNVHDVAQALSTVAWATFCMSV